MVMFPRTGSGKAKLCAGRPILRNTTWACEGGSDYFPMPAQLIQGRSIPAVRETAMPAATGLSMTCSKMIRLLNRLFRPWGTRPHPAKPPAESDNCRKQKAGVSPGLPWIKPLQAKVRPTCGGAGQPSHPRRRSAAGRRPAAGQARRKRRSRYLNRGYRMHRRGRRRSSRRKPCRPPRSRT
jgi:hypothetical protein